MGLIKLRSQDLALARDESYHDPTIERGRWEASELIERFELLADRMGVAIDRKGDNGTPLSRMSTTYYTTIRLGTSYDDKSPAWQAVTLGHELCHARQWRGYGRSTFRTRYLFWPRWRWSIEMQAYRESIRVMMALRFKASTIADFIDERPDVLLDKYAIGTLDHANVRTYTQKILWETAIG